MLGTIPKSIAKAKSIERRCHFKPASAICNAFYFRKFLLEGGQRRRKFSRECENDKNFNSKNYFPCYRIYDLRKPKASPVRVVTGERHPSLLVLTLAPS